VDGIVIDLINQLFIFYVFILLVILICYFFVTGSLLNVVRNFLGFYFIQFFMTFCLEMDGMPFGYVNVFLNNIIKFYCDFLLKYSYCYF